MTSLTTDLQGRLSWHLNIPYLHLISLHSLIFFPKYSRFSAIAQVASVLLFQFISSEAFLICQTAIALFFQSDPCLLLHCFLYMACSHTSWKALEAGHPSGLYTKQC